jgi:lipoprotein NlpI
VIRLDAKNVFAYIDRGNAYGDRDDYDHAFADYAEAIKLDPLPRLSPSTWSEGYDHVNVYYNRGLTYIAMGDYDHAISDYTEAIRLDPKYALAYKGRANAYLRKSDNDRAVADYDEAIRIDPTYAKGYFDRGLAHLYGGNLAKALTDERQAGDLDPSDAYTALWADIVGQRSNVPSRLSEATSKIDMTAWPAPIIRMFLGQMTPAAALAAANDPNALTRRVQVCEANFYGAQMALRQGTKGEAARLFTVSVHECRKDNTEWIAARRELKALGAAP